MRKLFTALFLLACLGASQSYARVDLLLVPPADTEAPSRRPVLTLYLNNPTEFDSTFRFEAEIEAEYAEAGGHAQVWLVLVDESQRTIQVPKMSRRTVKLRPATDITGWGEFISLRLRSPATNAIMLHAVPPQSAAAATVAATPPTPHPAPAVTRPGLGRRHIDLTSDIENMRLHISGYDPIYFAFGWRERFNARFQFSFKYRLVEPGPGVWDDNPWQALIGRAHFAYTQTSIWDLAGFSKPFYDSSYKPTVFLLHSFRRATGTNWRFSVQSGAQHESNGKGGGAAPIVTGTGLISADTRTRHPLDSRSLNTLYVLPRARWEDDGSHFFEAAVRASAYFHEDENPDIARYRGYAELTLRGGYVRGLQLSAQLRGKIDGHGSIEFNLTWPTSESPLLQSFPLVSTLGGYAQIQYFNGYGESLLDYDVRRKDQLRFGLMIVR
jgi:outer membrane phospholipase A